MDLASFFVFGFDYEYEVPINTDFNFVLWHHDLLFVPIRRPELSPPLGCLALGSGDARLFASCLETIVLGGKLGVGDIPRGASPANGSATLVVSSDLLDFLLHVFRVAHFVFSVLADVGYAFSPFSLTFFVRCFHIFLQFVFVKARLHAAPIYVNYKFLKFVNFLPGCSN